MSCLMFPSMQVPRIDLFEWLLQNAPHATHNLAFSNIHGLTIQEYKTFTDLPFPDDFELGSNAQYGADALKKTLLAQCTTALADNIVTTTGATEANFLVFSSLLRRKEMNLLSSNQDISRCGRPLRCSVLDELICQEHLKMGLHFRSRSP